MLVMRSLEGTQKDVFKKKIKNAEVIGGCESGSSAANAMPFKCADKLPNLSHAAYQKAHLSLFFFSGGERL